MSKLFVNTIQPNSGDTVTISGSLLTTGKLTIGDTSTDTVDITAEITSSLIPDLDDTFNLGSSTKQWKDLYIDGIAFIDSASINELGSNLIPVNNNALNLGSNTKKWLNLHAYYASINSVSSSLIPDADDAFDLGSSAKQWKDLYVDGTANIDAANINTLNTQPGGVVNVDGVATISTINNADISTTGSIKLLSTTTASLHVSGATVGATDIIFDNLPTSEPTVTGSLWLSGSTATGNSAFLAVFTG